MVNPDYTKPSSFTDINRPFITNNVLNGIVDFYNWIALDVGAFVNITKSPPTVNVYGGNRYQLQRVEDNRYTANTVWQGFRGNWVWESGIDYLSQPVHPTGVWVNGTFYYPNHTTYGHYVDYPRGRVVFNNQIGKTSTVETDFATRTVYFMDAENPCVQKLMFNSWDISSSDWNMISSGIWSEYPDSRVQLPVVGVELVPVMSFRPLALAGGQWCNQDILFHIFAEDKYIKRQIYDFIVSNSDRTIWLPNYALMKSSARYPLSLDYRGSPVPSALQYPDLVNEDTGYQWRKVQFNNMRVQDLQNVGNRLFRAIVRTTINIRMDNMF